MRLLLGKISHTLIMIARSGPRTAAAAVLALVLTSAGCANFDGSSLFLKRHTESREASRERWNEMRGQARLQVASRHLDAGRLDDAMREVEQVIVAFTPNSGAAFMLATRIWLEKGELARALESIAAAARCSDDPEVDYLAGIVAQRYDDRAGALEAFRRAAIKAPLVAEYVLAHAELLLATDRPLDALALVESRMRDFDRNVALREMAASIHRSLGLRSPAVERAREAVRLSENAPEMIADLGEILVWAGQPVEAISVLAPLTEMSKTGSSDAKRNAADTHDDDPPRAWATTAAFALARAHLGVGRAGEAIEVLTALIETCPNHLAARTLLARAALADGNVELAYETLTSIEEELSTHESQLLLSFVALKHGDFDLAASAALEARRLDDKNTTSFCLLGQALERAGRSEQARQAYCEALAANPDDVMARTLLLDLCFGRLLGVSGRQSVATGALPVVRGESLDGGDS